MKTINFRNPIPDEITEAGINLVCDKDMNIKITDEDFERLEREFPDAFMDCYIIENDARYAVTYWTNGDECRYVASINDYRDGGFDCPTMMTYDAAKKLVAELNDVVELEYIGKNDDENRRAHEAFAAGEWGFDIEEF